MSKYSQFNPPNLCTGFNRVYDPCIVKECLCIEEDANLCKIKSVLGQIRTDVSPGSSVPEMYLSPVLQGQY